MLETHRLILRSFISSDWKDIKSILSDAKVNHYLLFSSWPEQKLREWFDSSVENGKQINSEAYNWAIVLKPGNTVIGWLGASRPAKPVMDKERTINCALHRQFWRQGYMTEVLEAIFAYEFTLNGILRISGTCASEDIASARMMEKAGMVHEGTFSDPDYEGKPANRLLYAIHQNEYFSTDK